ncbi:Bacterial regulatory protein, MarR [Candidatus Omnitrophus magneticus]|uniref:Bacterial regulatory protein, MarR n=1 Tax=Candidatus Omnitrophus magneticus TaxID=1609969 RepID=A0A0F0CMY1_9BACT|nr:Bacterial regulatory protein, MarR [Candidatus Omnitrophus magneticus]
MNINEFAEKMMGLYPRIASAISQYESDYLSQGKITLPQFWALDYLYANGASAMTTLARFFKTSKAATTGLTDRLIIQGLILRKKDNSDRRLVKIELTSKGRSIIETIRKHKHKHLVRLFKNISARDRKEYLRILEQVVKLVSETKS